MRSLRFLVYVLPAPLLGPLAGMVSRLAPLFASRDRKVLRWNLENVRRLRPGTEDFRDSERRIARHQVISSLETIRGIHDPSLVRVDGVEGADGLGVLMEEMETGEGGQILITAHLGSWELLSLGVVRAARRPFYALAKPARIRRVDRLLKEFREKVGLRILWTDDRSLLRKMIAVLKGGDWLSFVMDQRPEGRRGPVVEFLGRPTEFVSGPAAMAIRFNVPVIGVFCLRVGDFHYRVETKRILPHDHGETDEAHVTQLMATAIEEAIHDHPDQWCWNYKRWPIP
jgi:KDO2-lipid IV(A) lauroyltransferase